MAQAGQFDVMVVRELDRLSRDLAKQLIVEEELSKAGVRVEYVLAEYNDTPEGRLSKHIRATIAEYEREKVKERMLRGKRQKVKTQNVIVSGNPPYGYRVKKQDGKTNLIIDESEAQIVRLIFTWYVLGDDGQPLAIYAIRNKLNDMNVPPPSVTRHKTNNRRKKPQWNRSVVARVLKRETYTGVWHYGKTRRNGVQNPRDKWLAVKVPAIISYELWEAAQARAKQNLKESKRNTKRQYLLRGRVTCASCNHRMNGLTNGKKRGDVRYYGHTGERKDRAFKGKAPYFRADKLEENVWDWIKEFLENPKLLILQRDFRIKS